jgi:hypothetical protein
MTSSRRANCVDDMPTVSGFIRDLLAQAVAEEHTSAPAPLSVSKERGDERSICYSAAIRGGS